MNLIARKPLTYATRRLVAGDPFVATKPHGRILVAIGKAEAAPIPTASNKPASQVDCVPDVLLDLARDDYRARFGRFPDPRWKVETIRARIPAAPEGSNS